MMLRNKRQRHSTSNRGAHDKLGTLFLRFCWSIVPFLAIPQCTSILQSQINFVELSLYPSLLNWCKLLHKIIQMLKGYLKVQLLLSLKKFDTEKWTNKKFRVFCFLFLCLCTITRYSSWRNSCICLTVFFPGFNLFADDVAFGPFFLDNACQLQ